MGLPYSSVVILLGTGTAILAETTISNSFWDRKLLLCVKMSVSESDITVSDHESTLSVMCIFVFVGSLCEALCFCRRGNT